MDIIGSHKFSMKSKICASTILIACIAYHTILKIQGLVISKCLDDIRHVNILFNIFNTHLNVYESLIYHIIFSLGIHLSLQNYVRYNMGKNFGTSTLMQTLLYCPKFSAL